MKKDKRVNLPLLFLVLSLSFIFPLSSAWGKDPVNPLPEYQIKAVYLYKFIQFVRWPEDAPPADTITIGILGKDPFGDAFVEVDGKEIKSLGKTLVVQRLGAFKKSAELDKCNLLYIHVSEKENLKEIFRSLSGKKVLLFSDMDGFLEAGGMIRFVKEGEKIRWEMNKKTIDVAGIKLNAQIFQLAIWVIQ